MSNDTMTPKERVIALMNGTVPERREEIASLWKRYDPNVELAKDGKHITLNATKDRIQLDIKAMDVFWLIAFGGWRSIECYAPLVVASAAGGGTIAQLIALDPGLADVERTYKERRAAAQSLINTEDAAAAPWPPDIPRPSGSRNAFDDTQHKVVFDLTCLAAAFALFHEFRHVMLDRDDIRPKDLREEEMACDVWARAFMTEKLAKYASNHGHDYAEVLRKRAMGFTLAALIIHEITREWDLGGNQAYFSVADRLRAILGNTPLPANDHFWALAASLLVGMFRQRHTPIDAPAMSARELAHYLLDRL